MFKGPIRAFVGNWPWAIKTLLVVIPAAYVLFNPIKIGLSKLWLFLSAQSGNTLFYDLFLGIATNILSVAILAIAAYVWYRVSPRFRLNGKYRVEILTPQAEIFGTVYLLVAPFSLSSNGVPARLRLIDKTQSPPMKIDGLATITNGNFLIGHYAESQHSLRRRFGTVFYERDGTGKIWTGTYTFVDPTNGQQHGTARWVRED